MVAFGQKLCIRAKVVVFWQKRLYSGKIVVLGQKWLYSGKVVVIGEKCSYSGKVVVFGQWCVVQAKEVVFGQKWFYSRVPLLLKCQKLTDFSCLGNKLLRTVGSVACSILARFFNCLIRVFIASGSQ